MTTDTVFPVQSLPTTAGTVIETESGVWFVLYPPDKETPRWQWLSSGGDTLFSDTDRFKRVIAYGVPENIDRYGVDTSDHTLAAYEAEGY